MEKKYFKLQLKSIFKMYPSILLVTMLTVVSIVVTCVVVLRVNRENENKQKMKVAVVGDLQDTYLDIGLKALTDMDNYPFSVEIIELSEQEAIHALEERDIVGFVEIPDNYISTIFYGKNVPARYVTLSSTEELGSILSSEITNVISNVVVESQNGMYSMQNLAYDYNTKNLDKNIDGLMLSYIDFIINRSDMFKIISLGLSDSLSFAGYYICGLLILFMLLWGIACNRIFSSRSITYSRLLSISGVKSVYQILGEYAAYLIVSLSTLLLFAILFGGVTQFVELDIPELLGLRIVDCIWFIIKIFPVIIMITMMQFAFYELISNSVAAVLMQFLLAIVLGYISGCFYPNYFFPKVVQEISSYLPVGTGFSYLGKIMSGTFPLRDLCVSILYTAAFFSLTVFMRNYKITGEIK